MNNKEPNDVEILLEGLDENSIDSLLKKVVEVGSVKKKIEELEEMLRTKIKIFLKEKNWERYIDEKSKISVSLVQYKKTSIDKQQLKMMITDAQYAQVTKIQVSERMTIMTPEVRKRLKNYVKVKKKI